MRRVSKLIPVFTLVATLTVAEAYANEQKQKPQPPFRGNRIVQLLKKFVVTILDDMSVPKP